MTRNEAIWKSFDRIITTFERRYFPIIGRAINQVGQSLSNQLEGLPNVQASQALVGGLDLRPVNESIAGMWLNVAGNFAIMERNKFNKSQTKQFNIARLEDLPPELRASIQAMVEEYSTKIVGIDNTIQKLLNNAIENGMNQGLGTEELALEIRKLWPEISRIRSQTIVRTEVIASANRGALEGAESTGMEMEKEWISTMDNRTRPDHAVMDGVRVPIDGMFQLPTGAMMQHPGDPSGGPEEVINCRCTVAFVPVTT